MAVQLGSGEYTFEVNENWANIPEEITLGDCAAVGGSGYSAKFAGSLHWATAIIVPAD
jgi:hypothetical protein